MMKMSFYLRFKRATACLLLIFLFLSCAPASLQGTFSGSFFFEEQENSEVVPSSEGHTFTFYGDGQGRDKNHITGYTATFSYTVSGDRLTLSYLDLPGTDERSFTFSTNDAHLNLTDTETGIIGEFTKIDP